MLHNVQEARRGYDAAVSDLAKGKTNRNKFLDELAEEISTGKFNPVRDRWDIREVFEEFVVRKSDGEKVGRHYLSEMRRRPGEGILQEASGAVTTAHFANIIGQMQFGMVMEKFNLPQFIGEQLHGTFNSTTDLEEMIPTVSTLGDVAEKVGEGEDYPQVGFGSHYYTAPKVEKDGFILSVTEELMNNANGTGLVSRAMDTYSESMAITREYDFLENALGTTATFRRNGNAAEATYGDSHTSIVLDNLLASTPLTDWEDIDAVMQLFNAMINPDNGQPIVPGQMTAVIPMALWKQSEYIANATTVEKVDNQAAAGTLRMTIANPLKGNMSVTFLTNPYVKLVTGSDSTWFIGDFKKAFLNKVRTPVTVQRQDANSEQGFTRDIVAAIKVKRREVPFCMSPWNVVKVTG